MTRATDIEQEASTWLIRSEAENFTSAMQMELDRWLQDPRNKVEFVRIKEAWRRANRLRITRPFDGNIDLDLFKPPPRAPANAPGRKRSSPRPFRVATAAASCLVAYLAGLAIWVATGSSDWISYTTSIGGYEHVNLADGSSIQLNTDTVVKARVTPTSREIKVVRGEALIQAADDPRRPMVVTAAYATAHPAPSGNGGTAFVVRIRPSRQVDIGVTNGSITVDSSPYRIIDVALRRYSSTGSILQPGETASVDEAGVRFERVGLDELDRKLSWTRGLLTFRGETLTRVVDEFNRYNRQQLLVTDPRIANLHIGGAFQEGDPDSFVAALEKWFNVHADEQAPNAEGDSIIRLRLK